MWLPARTTTSSGLNAPRLIVGLGNPGETYRDTRHNIGFMVLDEIARRLGTAFREEKRWTGLVAKFSGGHLLKPLTFMNDSGRSVQSVAISTRPRPRRRSWSTTTSICRSAACVSAPAAPPPATTASVRSFQHFGTDEFPASQSRHRPHRRPSCW
jgi:hypothetical protein